VSAPAGQVRERRIAEAAVLITVMIWSANFVVVKAAIGAFGPLTFTALRWVVAVVTLFLLVRWRSGTIRWPGRVGPILLGLGVLGFGCYQVLWTVGLTQITAGNSALLIAASPVLVALLAGAVRLDRLTPPKLGGAVVAFGGVAIVIAAGHELSLGASLVGDALTLGAAALWAVYTTAGARLLQRIDPLQATAWSVLGGALFLLPFGLWEATSAPPGDVTLGALAGVLYSGALAAGISNVIVFNAIRHVGPTRVSSTQFLVPAGAVVLGAIVLSEPVGVAQVVGGAVIVAGVWLTRRPSVVPSAVRTRMSQGR
jgi:drug/metabolite transporter (DMT)-like permease